MEESWQFQLRTNGAARLWIDDHILVDTSCDHPTANSNVSRATVPPSNCIEWSAPSDGAVLSYAGRDNVTHHIHNGLHIRLEWLHYGGNDALLQLLWRPGTPSTLAGAHTVGKFLYSKIVCSWGLRMLVRYAC